MTREEARKALFELKLYYKCLPPKEREEKETEYQQKKAEIVRDLVKTIFEEKEKERKIK